MFATLIGTNTGGTAHRDLADRLFAIAIEEGFAPPHARQRVRGERSLDGWSINQWGPADGEADFLLAVTEPRVPGMSPIFPVFKTVSGPIFAVVVLESAFVVSREDRRDVSELMDADSVTSAFHSFVDWLRKRE